jgi:hypothetical protein
MNQKAEVDGDTAKAVMRHKNIQSRQFASSEAAPES